ncbi:hypothetical protein JX266_000209 [Neoarthrinium moseri]|nr:hypothetical protein JX266_000209 [Neoarthrinium moseri]
MWDWVSGNKPQFDLVTITPPWIYGPYGADLKSTKHLCESLSLLRSMVDGEGVVPFDFGGYADAREISAAHVLARQVAEAGGQRFWVGQGFQYQSAIDTAKVRVPELEDRLPEG